jgi:CRISPR-associated protein Csb1
LVGKHLLENSPMHHLSLQELQDYVSDHAAIRRRRMLTPIGGAGDKVFPPTYPADGDNQPPVHAFETRWIDGREVTCVILDSVQSRANRLEASLLAASDRGDIKIPYLELEFTDPDLREEIGHNGRITSLDAPHRIFDAAFRDSLLDGTPFMSSELGQRLARSKTSSAIAVLEVSPHTLIFGAWHTQGEGGGTGAKFPRVLVSEIFGVDTPVEKVIDSRTGDQFRTDTAGRRTTSRIDPLSITKGVSIFKGVNGDWGLSETDAGTGAKAVRPSEINHGHITPSVQRLGVTMAYATEITALSFPALRQLGFGGVETNQSARTYLACLGLLACLEQERYGYSLRSRCDLVPEGKSAWELVFADGNTQEIQISLSGIRELYDAALRSLVSAGVKIRLTPTRLLPQEKLVSIVRQSRGRSLRGEVPAEEGRE